MVSQNLSRDGKTIHGRWLGLILQSTQSDEIQNDRDIGC
jgi:hypothetical protein